MTFMPCLVKAKLRRCLLLLITGCPARALDAERASAVSWIRGVGAVVPLASSCALAVDMAHASTVPWMLALVQLFLG